MRACRLCVATAATIRAVMTTTCAAREMLGAWPVLSLLASAARFMYATCDVMLCVSWEEIERILSWNSSKNCVCCSL